MRRWFRVLALVVVVILALAAGAYWWLLLDTGAPGNVPAFSLDMARVRALADELPGEKPTEVRVEIVATASVPQAMAVAGGGWGGLDMGFFAYQLVFPHQTMIVDAGVDEETGRQFNAVFQPGSLAAVTGALGRAAQVVVTHEHPDHLGAILDHPDPGAIVGRLSLTIEQIANAPGYLGATKPPPVLAEAQPIAYDDYFPVAPGVVLVKTPGHSPGSQMIFAALADGRQYLFAGDIGWTRANIDRVRGRPRLTAEYMLHEDAAAVQGQLEMLNALAKAEPDLVIVPGHDLGFIRDAIARGMLIQGFSAQ